MNTAKQEKVSMQIDQQEIWHLYKYGRSEDVRAIIEQERRANYPKEFVPFMDQMLLEKKISRKEVAIRSGLSQDYVYKLLRGDKHTDERDYILAMCFALNMTLGQTQHALASYGMPKLSRGDARSNIIILAIVNKDDIDELNLMLEKAGFPLLKTNPNMPSAVIVDTLVVDEPSQDDYDNIHQVVPFSGDRREFVEIDSFTEGHHNGGNAPFDYDYQGWIKLKDKEGNIYQVEAIFKQEYSSFLVFTEEQRKEAEQLMEEEQQRKNKFYEEHKDILKATNGEINPYTQEDLYDEYLSLLDDIPEANMLEFYECLEDAAGSEFFPYFLELDKRTDKKVQEVMSRLDDTREYGARIGASLHGNEKPKQYIEMFNDKQPELREYFQLVEYEDGTCRYTATHESCFMQLEMGQELYEAYFGKKREPEYYIDSDKNEFTGSQVRYRFIFNTMKMMLHDQISKTGSFFKQKNALEDKLEFLIEQGVLCHHSGNDFESIPFYEEAIRAIENAGPIGKEYLSIYVCTCYKLAMTYAGLNNPEAATWWNTIIKLKDDVLSELSENKEDYDSAISSVAEAIMYFYRQNRITGNYDTAKQYLEEAIDLMDNHNACDNNWPLQFEAHGSYAAFTEDEDLEKSLHEYKKTIIIARNHHLDQNSDCAHAVAIQYNNYAWVLWNKVGSEEAIIYYGRAIDLLESYLYSGIVGQEEVIKDLKHVGSALNQIYIDTNRMKESENLKERLAENGIKLKNNS